MVFNGSIMDILNVKFTKINSLFLQMTRDRGLRQYLSKLGVHGDNYDVGLEI